MVIPWTTQFMQEQTALRELVRRAKAGDLEAFERLLILHERLVLRTAQRLLLDSEDAKDAAQEVFVRMHRHLGRFHEERDLIPWLYRVTVNTCHDLRRRSKRADSVEDAVETSEPGLNPEEIVLLAERHTLIASALRGLSERERQAIVLRDIEGLTTRETAAILASSEATIRSLISIGRMKIRQFVMTRLRRHT